MKDARFAIGENILPLVAPVDTAATEKRTPFLDMRKALHTTVILLFGVVTAASADQPVTVTVTAATSAASTSETAIAFRYRLSSAAGANAWGAITAATSSGVALDSTTVDGKALLIDIDPAALPAIGADNVFVSVVVTPDAGASVTLVAALALSDPQYPSINQQSMT
jgi:hypothetical protein